MKRVVVVAATVSVITACAAQKETRAPSPPQASRSSIDGDHDGVPDAVDKAKSDATTTTTPAPAPGVAPSQPPSDSTVYAAPPSRSAQIASAARAVESSQRELDVAGGDCSNACRALGSMDRAAGHLCELAEAQDEQRRCEDAKAKVYSARARVKNTCGSCPGGASVERRDPIPSTKQ